MTVEEIRKNYVIRGQRCRETSKELGGFIWVLYDGEKVINLYKTNKKSYITINPRLYYGGFDYDVAREFGGYTESEVST